MTPSTWAARFEDHATAILDLYKCPGLALGVADHGEMIYFKGFGARDVEHSLPLTPDTVMGIGSCTKSFTAVAIMQLQEAGLLSVYDPVVKFLPEFRTPDLSHTRAITLHHLMTHTAGLPPLPTLLNAIIRSMKADPSTGIGNQLDSIKEIDTFEELATLIAETPLELLGPPGTRFSYSNDGFALLGAVVERVSGMSYAQYLRERILGPAGMTRTVVEPVDLADWDDVATLYSTRRREDGESEVCAAPGFWRAGPHAAAGQMCSTIHDLLRYCEIYRTGGTVGGVRILSEASVRAMMTPYTEYHDGLWYGYGLQVAPAYHGVSLVEHGGSIKGVSAQFTVVPGRELTAVALTNLSGVPSGNILLAALNGALDLPLETRRSPLPEYPATVDELARCAATFAMTEGLPGTLITWVEAGKLMVRAEGGMDPLPATALTPIGPARFVAALKPESNVLMRFHFDAYGQVSAVSLGLRMLRRAPDAQ